MNIELWHEITLSAGTALGILGFFRTLEQRKDSAFGDLMARLCNQASPVMQAGAAKQLPSFHRYRRFLFLHRPYGQQALDLAVNALKMKDEPIFVRQALVEALTKMMPSEPAKRAVRLHHAYLDDLIMMGFDLRNVELIDSSITHSGLEGACLTGAHLWRTKLCFSNLRAADLSDAKLWNADLSSTNLENAKLLTDQVNNETNLSSARLCGAIVSRRIEELCRQQHCDLDGVRVS